MNYLTDEELQLCSEIRASCACNKLRMGARGLTQLYEATMAQSGLKVTQLPVLVALASVGDVPITALSNILRIDRTTLTRNLKVLEDRGLVTTYESEDDARVRMVSFTLEGSRALPERSTAGSAPRGWSRRASAASACRRSTPSSRRWRRPSAPEPPRGRRRTPRRRRYRRPT